MSAPRSQLARHAGAPPIYQQIAVALRELALAHPWGDDQPLPPEGQLMERFGASRGTVRRATEELVRAGLLRAEPGRGTFVDRRTQVRLVIHDALAGIALPDSRWHLDVDAFVPDFAGSARCHELLRELPAYHAAATVFITPDNSLERLRALALDDGKTVLVPTFGMRRGIVALRPDAVPPADRELAATLDGLERKGQRLTLAQLTDIGGVDLLVTGAMAVTSQGVHIGGGQAYLDLEWGILTELGLAGQATTVAAVVHPVQVVDAPLRPQRFDLPLDTIVTPDGVLDTGAAFPRPHGITWQALRPDLVNTIAYLAEMEHQHHAR
ncbi:5-formyltetrahydrofolate cyclo-ligase [Saccharomonospora sp. NPDC046836]|uniref:5-formyltetrahydrofolate cyclo-ligase n=1 Tax=Saccharomonospora sp. NPDC046836 TaxID=3156921 RepID=UPI0033C4F718